MPHPSLFFSKLNLQVSAIVLLKTLIQSLPHHPGLHGFRMWCLDVDMQTQL